VTIDTNNRHEQLCRLGKAGAELAAGSWLQGFGHIHKDGPARAVVDRSQVRAQLDRRLFGGFLEHLGRAVYEGVYQPGSPLADDDGFRTDLLEQVKQMALPIVRYPGGNFVSGYNWLDGVGPRSERPTVHEKAWNSTETNQFGTNEFVDWCSRIGAEPMLVFNLGTNTPEMAVAYVEYCNRQRGSQWSDLRRAHGAAQPHGVQYWCLGNELDGPWQMGHMTALEYGQKARRTAQLVHGEDPALKLIAAGSSNTELPTYLDWDREVLEQCYEQVDAISLHNYYGNSTELSGGNSSRYLAMNLDMERQIQEIAAVGDYVQNELGSPKKLWLAFDEWNIWYRARSKAHMDGKRQIAPRLLEEEYNLEDALLVGGIVNTLLRRSDRVRVGCLAQIVNVIAPLVTSDEGLLRQSIYYPYAWALEHARGRVLDTQLACESYGIEAAGLRPDFARDDRVPFLDVAVTLDEENGQACVFALNRDLEGERELVIDWRDPAPKRVLLCETLTGPDLKAANTFAEPGKVIPQTMDAPKPGPTMSVKLPPASYTVLKFDIT